MTKKKNASSSGRSHNSRHDVVGSIIIIKICYVYVVKSIVAGNDDDNDESCVKAYFRWFLL